MNTHIFRGRRLYAAGLVAIMLSVALVACGSDDTATPSPTSSGTAEPSASPTETPPTATPSEGDGTVLIGAFQFGFEQSGFYPAAICPDDGPAYWVTWEGFDFGAALEAETGTAPFAGGQITTYRVEVEGELSEPGSYGHLGQYERELLVTALVSAELADDCNDVGSVPNGSADADAVAEYEAALALWEGSGIESYRFTLQRNCFCPPEFRGPFEITVVDGGVTEALYEGVQAEDGVALTIDELFERIDQALESGVLTELAYDPTDGHPVTVRLDLSAIAADGGFSVDVLDLASAS